MSHHHLRSIEQSPVDEKGFTKPNFSDDLARRPQPSIHCLPICPDRGPNVENQIAIWLNEKDVFPIEFGWNR
jgi:hypothetical protein